MELINKIPNWVRIAILSIILIAISFKAFDISKKQFVSLYNENLTKIVAIDADNYKDFVAHSNPAITTSQKELLSRKVKILSKQRHQYLDLTGILYKNYYGLLSLFPFISGLTAVFIFIIMQKGWEKTNIYIKGTFMILAFISALVGIYPEVYQQKENITRYSNVYLEYTKLQKDIYNYNQSAPFINTDDSITFKDFIIKINNKDKSLVDFYLGLEKKEISKDAFDLN
nr:hypothetical protein [uncultured Psychroserpens sp.]